MKQCYVCGDQIDVGTTCDKCRDKQINNATVRYDPGREEESSMIVYFNGFIIDFFKTESGSLGMTVEVGEEITPEAPSVDIFVDKFLNINVIEA